MTPSEQAALAAFTNIMKLLSTAPIGSLIVIVLLAPWFVLAVVTLYQNRRFEAVVKMYESNYAQTEGFKSLTEGYSEMAKGFRELVIWTTSVSTEVKQAVLTNMNCPLVRKTTNPKDIITP